MSRTTPEKVIQILISGKQYDAVNKPDVGPFIEAAGVLTDRVSAADSNSLLSDNALEKIESWLSAHCYAHADQLLQSKSTGGASGQFQGQTGMGLDSTQYGQMAKRLDFTGELARIDKQASEGKQTAGMVWLGTRYRNDNSERTSDQ